MRLILEGTDCTHAEEPKGSTEDGTKQGRFGVDVLWRSNSLNDLANDTTIIHNVSLLLMGPKESCSGSTEYSHCLCLAIKQRLVVIGKVLVYCYRGLVSKMSK